MAEIAVVAAASGRSLLLVVVTIFTLGGFVSGSEDIILHGNNGTFLSPNYPSNYDNNLDLLYIAHLDTPGPQQVQLDYVVDIERSPRCSFDYVLLPDLSKKLCGTRNGTLYISIEGDMFNISFRTGRYLVYSGFNITYSALQGTCKANLSHENDAGDYVLLPITDMMTRHSVVFSARSCDGIWIVLGHEADPSSGNRREVKIGVSSSARNGYWSGLETKTQSRTYYHERFTHTTRLQDCCYFRPFWVSWTTTSVAVGTGSDVGANTIAQATTSIDFTVRFFHWYAYATSVEMFDAPFPDSYCESPPQFTLPAVCAADPEESPDKPVGSDVTTTLPGITVDPEESPDKPVGSDVTTTLPGITVDPEESPDKPVGSDVTTTLPGITADPEESPDKPVGSDVTTTLPGITVDPEESPDKPVGSDVTTTLPGITADPEESPDKPVGSDVTTTLPGITSDPEESPDKPVGSDVTTTLPGITVDPEESPDKPVGSDVTTTLPGITADPEESPDKHVGSDVTTTLPGITVDPEESPDKPVGSDVTTTLPDTGDLVTKPSDAATHHQYIITTADDGIITTENNLGTADGDHTSIRSEVDMTAAKPRPPPPVKPPVLTYNREQCWCKCVWQRPPVKLHYDDSLTESQVKQAEEEKKKEVKAKMAKEIEAKLKVPTSNVSSNGRRYVSAGDERPSSKYMAVVVGVVCFLPLAVFVLLDVISLLSAAVQMVGPLVSYHWK